MSAGGGTLRVAILAFDDVEALDLAGPYEVFTTAARMHQRSAAGTAPPFEATATFTKYRHSALVNSGLDVWLTQHGIRRLIVSGIRTEQCCETTTRHASDMGWQVDFVTEATLTFDMVQPDGRPLAAADIQARTATVLDGRFAKVCSAEEALARLSESTQ